MFTGAIAVAVGILFGLTPALQATRPELTASLKADAGTAIRSAFARRVSMRDALTAFEIALAVTLLAGSGVLVRTLVHLTAIRPGFEPRGVLTMRVNRAAAWSRDSITRFYDVCHRSSPLHSRRDAGGDGGLLATERRLQRRGDLAPRLIPPDHTALVPASIGSRPDGTTYCELPSCAGARSIRPTGRARRALPSSIRPRRASSGRTTTPSASG
jgi:hypothetical protein